MVEKKDKRKEERMPSHSFLIRSSFVPLLSVEADSFPLISKSRVPQDSLLRHSLVLLMRREFQHTSPFTNFLYPSIRNPISFSSDLLPALRLQHETSIHDRIESSSDAVRICNIFHQPHSVDPVILNGLIVRQDIHICESSLQ